MYRFNASTTTADTLCPSASALAFDPQTPAAASLGSGQTSPAGQPQLNNRPATTMGEVPDGSTTRPAGPVLTFIAHGQPKPKGSMRHVGHGRMVEQVDGKPWREAVKWAAIEAMKRSEHTFPLAGPVHLEATFTVRKPTSAPKTRRTWPVTRSSGDGDKLQRNLYDALQDAGVYTDDAQITRWTGGKCFPLEEPDALSIPGVVVRIYRIGDSL